MREIKSLSDYLRSKVSRRSYTQLLAYGAEALYGPGIAPVILNTCQATCAYLSALWKRLTENR